jgi:hypothetical protein
MYAGRQHSTAVTCPSVQIIALQRGTCQKDTDKVRHLERCVAHVVVVLSKSKLVTIPALQVGYSVVWPRCAATRTS